LEISGRKGGLILSVSTGKKRLLIGGKKGRLGGLQRKGKKKRGTDQNGQRDPGSLRIKKTMHLIRGETRWGRREATVF